MADRQLQRLLKVKKIRLDKADRALHEAREQREQCWQQQQALQQQLDELDEQQKRDNLALHEAHFGRNNLHTEFAEFNATLAQMAQRREQLQTQVEAAIAAYQQAEVALNEANAAKQLAGRQVEKFDTLNNDERKAMGRAAAEQEEAQNEEISELRYR